LFRFFLGRPHLEATIFGQGDVSKGLRTQTEMFAEKEQSARGIGPRITNTKMSLSDELGWCSR
jgi:hypothetical protein